MKSHIVSGVLLLTLATAGLMSSGCSLSQGSSGDEDRSSDITWNPDENIFGEAFGVNPEYVEEDEGTYIVPTERWFIVRKGKMDAAIKVTRHLNEDTSYAVVVRRSDDPNGAFPKDSTITPFMSDENSYLGARVQVNEEVCIAIARASYDIDRQILTGIRIFSCRSYNEPETKHDVESFLICGHTFEDVPKLVKDLESYSWAMVD